MLEKIFKVLHSKKLVFGKAFIEWEHIKDQFFPENDKNKQETIKQVELFLKELKENTQQEDPEGETDDRYEEEEDDDDQWRG